MIIGIGCDIVDHEVSKKLNWGTDFSVLQRIFSKRELYILSSKELKFLSGRFAAKEAVVKCLGKGMYDGIALSDIHILQTEDSCPLIELSGEVKNLSERLKINRWHVSITHCSQYSMAYVIAESV